VATNSAADAILLAEKHREQLKILLTDIVMPEMNGYDLDRTKYPPQTLIKLPSKTC
jgi:CheY-like chemotaxis protein